MENMSKDLDFTTIPPKTLTKLRTCVCLASQTRMEETRSGFATLKHKNYDPFTDNYISFSGEPYGETIIVWNKQKGNGGFNYKRYNLVIPTQLATLLNQYVDKCVNVYFANQEYLFPFDVSLVYAKDDPKEKWNKKDPKPADEIMAAKRSNIHNG